MNGVHTLVELNAAVPVRAPEADTPTDFEWLDDLSDEQVPAARTVDAPPTAPEASELRGTPLARSILHDARVSPAPPSP